MTQAERIIAKFGGRLQMSKSTPYHYERLRVIERKGVFPSEEFPDLLELAHAAGIDLTPFDFIAHLVTPVRRVTESAD